MTSDSKTEGGSAWPRVPKTNPGAPNVIVFLTDDVGYGACSTFGGPVPTPVLDQLAATGLRYTHFHTAAMCSPTRASLLTGRNPHKVEMGCISNRPTCFDGYTSIIPETAGSVAQVLRDAGYGTAMLGKSHLTPEWELTQAGPFARWPTGLGFDYFYGFLGYDTNMWAPTLVENTKFIGAPEGEARHFDALIADCAIAWIRQHKAVKQDCPFFMYYATGTAHAPHHAPPEWLARFRGAFDQGWDAVRRETFERQQALGVVPADARLTERTDGLPAWDSLSADQKKLAARLMEAYAGALAHADHQVGRVIDSLRESGELENTLVIFIQGDNGGSAEGGFNGLLFEQSYVNRFEEDPQYLLERIDDIGGPAAYNTYPAAWGWAMNTPFKYFKQVASHFGGTRNGMVLSWPKGIADRGGLRSQFHHVSDIMPTILDAAGVPPPATLAGVPQDPLDGISMRYTFDTPAAPSRRTTQIFECLENWGLYHEGWFAASVPATMPWVPLTGRKQTDVQTRSWELYDVSTDFSQYHDVSAREPQQLATMQALFWNLAKDERILPIHAPSVGTEGRPSATEGRTTFTYSGKVRLISYEAAPVTSGRSFTIAADVVAGARGGDGVIISNGGRFGGFVLYVRDSQVVFHYNALAPHAFRVQAPLASAPGRRHTIRVRFRTDEPASGSGGTAYLEVDGAPLAEGRIGRTLRTFINGEGLNVGCDAITPVCDGYTIADSEFDGEIRQVVINLE
ncbi:MAG TPA: sulfatase-like hydrolase/transferase [Ramlibacter sp.]|nr:sulfatase-like hydrolase/transferase [Ramlibacter sp.]